MAIAINKEDSSDKFSVNRSSSLEPYVRIPKVSPRLKSEVLVAAFGVLNVLIAHQIIGLDIFSTVRADLRSFWSAMLSVLAVVLLLYCGGSIFSHAVRDIKKGFISRNVCTSLALVVLASYAFSIASTNFRLLATQPFFDSLVIVLFIVALDKLAYESFIVSVANKVGLRFGELFPQTKPSIPALAEGKEGGIDLVKDLSPKDIKVGMKVRVCTDDIIPCDMEIISGSCEVRERKFSTRFQLRYKAEANNLFAGSRIVRGQADCIVTSLPEESVLAYFITVLNRRVNEETKLDTKESRRTESAYCLMLIFIAACTALYWTDQQVSTDEIIRFVASVLLISLIPRWFEVRRYLRGLAISAGFSRGLLIKSVSSLKKLVGIKSLAIDYSSDLPPGESRLTSFELIDNRLDQGSLSLVLATMYAATETAELQTISEDFRKEATNSDNFLDISDLAHFPGRGLCAKVQGADFTIGTEEFLLERGVELQPSEIGEPRGGQELFYVAIGTDPVAKTYISRPFLGDGRELSRDLKQLGVRPALLSTGDQGVVDKVAEAAGIERAYSHAGLDNQKFLSKLSSLAPAGLLATESTPQDFINGSAVSFAVFDEIRWDVDRTDVIAFNRNISFVSDCWKLARSYDRTIKLNAALAIGLSVLLLWLAISGYMAPVVTALSCGIASVFMYLSVYLLFPKNS